VTCFAAPTCIDSAHMAFCGQDGAVQVVACRDRRGLLQRRLRDAGMHARRHRVRARPQGLATTPAPKWATLRQHI
jgi:hypothetical protein